MASTHDRAPDVRTLFEAMRDLRAGRITAEEFRAVSRASRAANGTAGHDLLKARAAANLNR